MITEKSEITKELISLVENVLETYAAKEKTIQYNQIEKEIRETTDWRLWQDILDPIYKKSWDRDHFDLSLIVISKETGRPPYFSQGKEARSVPFNPKKHDKEWVKQLQLIFSTWKARKK